MKIKLFFIILFLFKFSFQESELYQNITNINKNKTKVLLKKLLEDNEDSEPILSNPLSLVLEFIKFANKYITDHDFLDFDNEHITKCIYEGIIEQLNDQDMLNTCIRGSGKALNDFGNEFECDSLYQSKAQYFTLHFSLIDSQTLTNKEDKIFMEFLGQHYFYIGLCVPKQCKEAIKYFMSNETYLKKLHDLATLSNFKVYYKDEVDEKLGRVKKIYNITIRCYLYFNLLKLVIGIIRIIAMDKGYDGFYDKNYKSKSKIHSITPNLEDKDNENEKLNKEKEENKKIEEIGKQTNDDIKKQNSSLLAMDYNENINDISSAYNQSINRSVVSDDIGLYNPFNDNEKKYPLYLKIIKILDFFDNVNILSTLSNRYYNSYQIKRLYIIRFVLMIMTILYQLVYSQMDLPYRNFVKREFYIKASFIIIKFCINSSTFWITLDAVIIGYKIMSFMKKEIKISNNNSLSFLSFFKFLLLVIPKFVVFFFAFVYLHIFSSQLTSELCSGNKVYSSFLYYNDTIQRRTHSIRQTNNDFKNILTNFIPFKLNYIDFIENVKKQDDIELLNNSTEDINNNTKSFYFDASGYELPSPFLTNTDLFVNVYFNEFYLLVLFLFICYISYKLRSKIFDYIILIINICLFFLPLLDLNKHQDKEVSYTLRHVLGQFYTEKYTHYFINFFYFGFLIGVMKFYYDENVFYYKQKKRNISKLNLPFEFCEKIIMKIHKLKFLFKRLILIFTIIILLLISSSFNIYQLNSSDDNDNDNENQISTPILFTTDGKKSKLYYLFLFEKNLCGIFFFIFLMIFIVYPKNANIIKLAERNGFIILERISFCFYCSFSYLIYAQFCVFIITLQLSYMNLFLNTLGMFLIIFAFSLVNAALFELPLRKVIKSFMNRNLEKRFSDFYDRNFSSSDLSNSFKGKKED